MCRVFPPKCVEDSVGSCGYLDSSEEMTLTDNCEHLQTAISLMPNIKALSVLCQQKPTLPPKPPSNETLSCAQHHLKHQGMCNLTMVSAEEIGTSYNP
jgi:hypothetical protein